MGGSPLHVGGEQCGRVGGLGRCVCVFGALERRWRLGVGADVAWAGVAAALRGSTAGLRSSWSRWGSSMSFREVSGGAMQYSPLSSEVSRIRSWYLSGILCF